MRAYHIRLAETADPDAPLPAYFADYLDALGIDPAKAVPAALIGMLDRAIVSAGNVRDRFSVDGWMALNDLAKTARKMAERVTPGDDGARAMSVLLRKITGFSGLVHENMYRFTGWRFLSIGRCARARHRHVERARLARRPAAPRTAPSTSWSSSATASCRTAAATPSPPPARPWSTSSRSTP